MVVWHSYHLICELTKRNDTLRAMYLYNVPRVRMLQLEHIMIIENVVFTGDWRKGSYA